jgi:hypothetical protein
MPSPSSGAVNEADKRDLIDPEALRTAVACYEGEPGAPLLRKLLDKRTFRLSDSDLEILFRHIAAEAGLQSRSANRWSTVGKSTSTGRNWAS